MKREPKPTAAELAKQLLETIKAEEQAANPDPPPYDEEELRARVKRDADEMRRARSR